MKKWRIWLKHGVVLIEFPPGFKIQAQALMDVYDELNSAPEKYRNKNCLWDLRNTSPDDNIGFDELTKVVSYFKEQWQIAWEQTKTALLVNDKLSFGMTRLYSTLAEGQLNYRVRIFEDDFKAAVSWAASKD